uniref:Nephronophthisis 1 n=1 Tax=Scophthalmus maximus TaxID=52904 RepID=A0A8D3E453_SCOMX
MQIPEPEGAVPGPLSEATVPSLLLDYDLSEPGFQESSHIQFLHTTQEAEEALFGPEAPSRATTPISQGTTPDHYVLKEECEQMQGDLHPTSSQVPDLCIGCQQTNQETVALRHKPSQIPKVDRLVEDVQSQSGSTEEALRRCQELQMAAEKKLKTLKTLTKADEPAPVGNYGQRKQEEERRLQDILERLDAISLELSPPGPSTAAGLTSNGLVDSTGSNTIVSQSRSSRNVSNEDSDVDSDVDDDDDKDSESDDADDEDVDEKRAVKLPHLSNLHNYKVVSDFRGEEQGDLSVQRGEVLRIIRKSADGWWLAQNTKGNRGIVPMNYLKIDNDGHDDDDNDDDYDDEDYDDDGDENEEEEEQDGEQLTDARDKQSGTSHSNWSTVKKALTEIDATDVLSAMGAIPSGFRPSTLNKLLVEEGVTHRGSHHIQPDLSQSQLSFKDLFLDPDTGWVRARQVRTCVCFTLWSCRRIPTPGVGVQVLSRHIRLCAFDGTQVLSNIHTVRATYNSKSPKTWNFSPRMTGILPTLLDGDCFLRCNSESPDLGILFELGVTFIRNSTGERGELSCGWAFLKLTDDAGNPLPNRTYELPVNGGTPYEQDVAVEASVTKGTPAGVLQQMLQARRQPRLIIKLKSTSSQIRKQLCLLPDTLLHSLSCVHLLALHRQLLADTLLMNRPTMQNADLICNPVLSTFPVLLDQSDLLDALRRDLSFLKQEFIKVYMSSVYFLLHSPSLPCHRWADPPLEEQRARVIYTTLDSLKQSLLATGQSGGPEVFVDPAHHHIAFDITELTFDLLLVARKQ